MWNIQKINLESRDLLKDLVDQDNSDYMTPVSLNSIKTLRVSLSCDYYGAIAKLFIAIADIILNHLFSYIIGVYLKELFQVLLKLIW